MGILIDEAKCIGCGLCELSCAYNAIDVHIKARVENSRCTDCTVCVDYCPTDAIAMERPPARPALPPREASFDAVVIGSGVGGLCAGALLAHRGYRTLVLERNPSVGGRYSSLRHNKVIVPTGGSLIGMGGPLQQVFEEVGADFDVVPPQANPRYWIRGRGWIDPGPGSGQLRRALTQASDGETADRVMGSMREILKSQQYPPGTLVQWLDSLTENEEVKGIFKAIAAAAFGPEDVPAGDFFGLLAATAGRGMGLARHGGLSLMRNLAKAIVQRGGQVWTRSEVKAIVLEEGKAVGVQVERMGQPWRIGARVIVSDAGPKQTARLIGHQNLDPQYLAYLEERVRPMTGITLHLISDKSLTRGFSGVVYTVGARRICILFEASSIAPWAPPGLHITELYPKAGADPAEQVDWEQHIQEAAADLDEIFPEWRQHARMRVVCCQGDYPGNQTWTGMGAACETPIPNVFLVGDGCESSLGNAGGTAAAESAQRAVALIQQRYPIG